jgi:hypothetical protein
MPATAQERDAAPSPAGRATALLAALRTAGPLLSVAGTPARSHAQSGQAQGSQKRNPTEGTKPH